METGKNNKNHNNKDFVSRSEFEAFKKSIQDASLKYNQQSPEYKRAMDRTMDEILPPKIIDIVWDKYFYYFDPFDSLDSLVITGTGGRGSATLTGGVFELESGNIANDTVTAQKVLGSPRSPLDFGKRQRFRTDFLATDFPLNASVLVGNLSINDMNYYGFTVDSDEVIYGVSANNGQETKVRLDDYIAPTGAASEESNPIFEARLDPINKVVRFLINDVEKGIISTNLPKQSEIDKRFSSLWIRQVQTEAAVEAILSGAFFEYIQER